MSYEIDRSDKTNYGSITVADQTINQETSLGFVGKNYTGYAKSLAENFLHLLENFAKATAPTNPIIGQRHDFIISKTGWIRASGGCIVMMVDTDIGRRIVVVLGSMNTRTRIPEAELISKIN